MGADGLIVTTSIPSSDYVLGNIFKIFKENYTILLRFVLNFSIFKVFQVHL
jgi:hypothetical protein